jgi:hypothetical protein
MPRKRTIGGTSATIRRGLKTGGAPLPDPKMTANSQMLLIGFFVILALVLFVLIVLIVVRIVRSRLTVTYIVTSPLNLKTLKEPVVYPNGKMPSSINGVQFCYSFWIYLNQSSSSTDHPLLFRRTPTTLPTYTGLVPANMKVDMINACSNPVVAIGNTTNEMHILLRSAQSKAPVMQIADMVNGKCGTTLADDDTVIASKIKYIPLARWVHIAFSVEDNVITIFIDGNIYSVMTASKKIPPVAGSGDLIATTNQTVMTDIGDMTIGGDIVKNPIDAKLNKLSYFNVAKNQKSIQSIYRQGPNVSSNLFGLLGFDSYAVRNPLYKVDE